MAKANGGNGGGNRNRGKKNPKARYNPKRGPPGILLFCETGRERKCLNEAMEILNHYYYCEEEDYGSNDNDNGKSSNGSGTKEKEMTLEEEISMLKQQKKKAPFHVYETGCKGVVFIMCTLQDSNLVSQPKSSSSSASSPSLLSKSTEDNEMIGKATMCQEESTETSTAKRKMDDKNDQDDNTSSSNHKKQKTDESNMKALLTTEENNNQGEKIGGEDDTTKKSKWDPIKTVLSIMQDIRNNELTAPRSRFITKMIPIQATCFANVEEIQSTATALIRKFLIPHGIQSYCNRCSVGQSKSNGNKENATTSNDDGEDQKKKQPTFKIEFRRRFCEHLKRDGVIELVAGAVQLLTTEYWDSLSVGKPEKIGEGINEKVAKGDDHEGESRNEKNSDTQLFGVDLKNPDYTIIVEICRTLCTMSIVKDAQSYHHFNLTKIQEDAD